MNDTSLIFDHLYQHGTEVFQHTWRRSVPVGGIDDSVVIHYADRYYPVTSRKRVGESFGSLMDAIESEHLHAISDCCIALQVQPGNLDELIGKLVYTGIDQHSFTINGLQYTWGPDDALRRASI